MLRKLANLSVLRKNFSTVGEKVQMPLIRGIIPSLTVVKLKKVLQASIYAACETFLLRNELQYFLSSLTFFLDISHFLFCNKLKIGIKSENLVKFICYGSSLIQRNVSLFLDCCKIHISYSSKNFCAGISFSHFLFNASV